jgi:lipopolysaccharide/colanic/teichoic acid biosynthesis glycosyltransferase
MNRATSLLIDLCLIALATLSALVLRENFDISLGKVQSLLPYLGATLMVAVPVLSTFGLDRSIWHLTTMSDYVRVVAAALVMVLVAVAVGFSLNRLDGVARSLPVLQAVLIVCGLVGARVLTRVCNGTGHPTAAEWFTFAQPVRPHDTVLVVGLNGVTELYLAWVAKFTRDHTQIAGVLACSERQTGRFVHQHPILGTPERVLSILRDLEVHGVFVDRIIVTVAFDRLSSDAQEALVEVAKTPTIRLDFFADRIGFEATEEDVTAPVRGLPKDSRTVLSRSASELEELARRPYWRVKRTFDIVGALGLSVALAPLMLLVALMVMVDTGRPVTFWQQRPGKGCRPFKLYKFRTMAAAHDRQGRRIADTERSSVIGCFLRRTRLDELPQLYNILIGEMSFVGPRPLLPKDQPDGDQTRLLVRPGLTGWAQVNGGRNLSVNVKTALDIWYVRNASLWLDAKILLQTALFVLFGERITAVTPGWRDFSDATTSPSEVETGQVNFGKVPQKTSEEADLMIESAGQLWSGRQ